MSFVSVSVDEYVHIYMKAHPGENEKTFRSRLETCLEAYENGVKCECGNDIWVAGSASSGYRCFSCTTGKDHPAGEYEIESALDKIDKSIMIPFRPTFFRQWFAFLLACGASLFIHSCSRNLTYVPEGTPSIIPAPENMEIHEGSFVVSGRTAIYYSPETGAMQANAGYLKNWISKATGLDLATEVYDGSKPHTGNILLRMNDTVSSAGSENYILEAGSKGILISGGGPAGVFYGIQTLRQLFPAEAENPHQAKHAKTRWHIPCLKISDSPRFAWRGMMLDVSRHFFDKEFVKDFIDYLAMHKMNRFHWHLVDDQGWRPEIKQYPLLTEVGAWRVDREDLHWNSRPPQEEGEEATYGGYYTQEDILEIVAYARERHITIVPEIEMPAHVSSALAAYPWLSCTGQSITVPPGGVWPITDIYCAGKEETFVFLENVLKEVMELFPGEYIHVGGDEATKTEWEKCPHCRQRMRAEGLKNVEELQSYFIRRMEAFLHANGRRLIGWDEILEGGLAPRAAVMSWRGTSGGIEAARSGHEVVMSPTSHCYFDYYQGPSHLEPPAIGGWLPLSKVYSFEPVPEELLAGEAMYILGAQANLWTEYISIPAHAQYMIFPRIAAMAEVCWSLPEKKDWEHFSDRLKHHMERWNEAGIHYATSSFHPDIEVTVPENGERQLLVSMKAEMPGTLIRFTTDGSDPGGDSDMYREPFGVSSSITLNALGFLGSQPMGMVNSLELTFNLATARPVKLTSPPSPAYAGRHSRTLTDGIRGSLQPNDGKWLGFHGIDFEGVIDLEDITAFSTVRIGLLHKPAWWIFLPLNIRMEVSSDGIDYEDYGEINIEPPATGNNGESVDLTFTGGQVRARYVRIKAENTGLCPPGHPGEGQKAWLFIDEIGIE